MININLIIKQNKSKGKITYMINTCDYCDYE